MSLDKMLYGSSIDPIREIDIKKTPLTQSEIESVFVSFTKGKSRANTILLVCGLITLGMFTGFFLDAVGSALLTWILRIVGIVACIFLSIEIYYTQKDLEPVDQKVKRKIETGTDECDQIKNYVDLVHSQERPLYNFEATALDKRLHLARYLAKVA